MRPNATKLAVMLAAGLLAMAPADGRAQTCNTNGPVVARPVADDGSPEFTFQSPIAPPSIPPGYHWTLLDDFPELATSTIRTGYINLSPSTPKTERYLVANPAVAAGVVFTSCTIRTQLLVNGGGTTSVTFVVKQGATQVDVGEIFLGRYYLMEYQSAPMRVHPVTLQPWTGANLSNGTIIGIRNAAGTWGVGIASIILQCE